MPTPTAFSAHAARAARATAHEAGIRLRELHDPQELTDAHALFDGVWRPHPSRPPITWEFLRVLAHSGNYVVGAYAGAELVGASVGLLGAPTGRSLHSHLVAVAPSMRGRRIGLALKLHQRAWAIERGIEAVTWTFDPLQRRNATFNIARLGARPVEYLPNFYGPLDDGINGTDESDRLLVRWPLARFPQRALETAQDRDRDVALGTDGDGGPRIDAGSGARLLLAALPQDIEALRRSDPAKAAAWRNALREVLGGLLTQGAQVTGFDPAGWYLIDRAAATQQQEPSVTAGAEGDEEPEPDGLVTEQRQDFAAAAEEAGQ